MGAFGSLGATAIVAVAVALTVAWKSRALVVQWETVARLP
jgi:hypothetical protein